MPRKGMRTVFFSSSKDSSPSPSLSSRPSTPLHSLSETMIAENLQVAESVITKWDPNSSTCAKVTSLFYESRTEAMEFLKSVKDLQRSMYCLLSHHSSSHLLVRAQTLMQIAIKRLEKEFFQILSANRDHLDPESISGRSSLSTASSTSDHDDGSEDDLQLTTDSISEVEQASTVAMSDLRSIAECMISSGYGSECVRIYKVVRKSIVDEGLYRLGIEQLSSSQIHKMDWEVLELKIKNWLNAIRVAVKTLFSGERILCDYVFSTSQSIRESCFSEICREGAIHLFGFAESVAKSKRSSEKMFRFLDLYDAISNLWPEIETIFFFESTAAVRSQALSSLIRLGDAVRAMLSDFESAIQKDPARSSVPGGGLHPLTRYVMNYLSLLADYSGSLSDIIANGPAPVQSPLPESYYSSPSWVDNQSSAISVRLVWIILVVLCKLDGKAELYKDVSLSYLFLANNLQYVVSKVRTSNLRYLLGEDWISNHEAMVKQYAASYERMGWNNVFSALPENPGAVASKEEAKEHFKRFSSAFEEAYRKQSSWVVTDGRLRDEIKLSIAKKLVPAYRELYDRYRIALSDEKNVHGVVRFAPDDLGNYLSDLFYGTGASGSTSSSSSSRSRGWRSQ
ncbi:PREDICTED: exocyst complex component EXO70B1-like [Nelumbo nucifera]|uniref:Exocyst subunit Exo70 family protein n=1 Tax=Nelumbo nucifera TaxID=4432 RepID=A0A1U7ZNK3_NELNU|nr:PREDICTED: exocyst complex component EXO70B1-like [Nelumbo nucifera]